MSAGGTWTKQNKVRPGIYINFRGKQVTTMSIGDRGTVALPLELNWGESGKVITVDLATNFVKTLGYELGSKELLLIREALKRANKVLLYRTNSGGTKASGIVGGLTIKAASEGIRGNDINVSVTKDSDKYVIKTYLDEILQDSQAVTDIAEFKSNQLITIEGEIEETAGVNLTGGANAAAGNNYQTALEALKTQSWNVFALCGGIGTTKASLVAYIKNLRENEGKYVVGVMSEYPEADYEGIISVKNGVTLQDGTELTAAQACAWVAGATAAAAVNESLTNTPYDGAVGTTPMLDSEVTTALIAGEFVFIDDGGKASVEEDINSLTTFTEDKPSDLRKNRVLRVLDAIGNDLRVNLRNIFIGKVGNDSDGRDLVKADAISYIQELQKIRAVDEFETEDVEVQKGDSSESILLNIAVKPVDAIEKIYTTILVN